MRAPPPYNRSDSGRMVPSREGDVSEVGPMNDERLSPQRRRQKIKAQTQGVPLQATPTARLLQSPPPPLLSNQELCLDSPTNLGGHWPCPTKVPSRTGDPCCQSESNRKKPQTHY